jgi:hypothetical protein
VGGSNAPFRTETWLIRLSALRPRVGEEEVFLIEGEVAGVDPPPSNVVMKSVCTPSGPPRLSDAFVGDVQAVVGQTPARLGCLPPRRSRC